MAYDVIEEETRKKYDGGIYQPQTICFRPDPSSPPQWIDGLFAVKAELVARYCGQDVVVDLCCASGEHMEIFQGHTWRKGLGVDFSRSFLHYAQNEGVGRRNGNMDFLCANARALPLATASVGGLYCLSSLYHVPKVGEVVKEVARVLKPGGGCVLELGNLRSLNTLVCKAHPELAQHQHVPVGAMLAMLKEHGLQVVEWRSFQLLPMWADRPKWLRPLLHPFWCRFLARTIGGKMLDEWVSSLPLLRRLAFRHVFACRKEGC
jgi:ubiquinone/menaquinone biosynthesis C-methylase UbiE